MNEPLEFPPAGGSVRRAREMAADEERRRREGYDSDLTLKAEGRRPNPATQRQQFDQPSMQTTNRLEQGQGSPSHQWPLGTNQRGPSNVGGRHQQSHQTERHQQTHPAMREAPNTDCQTARLQYQTPPNSTARLHEPDAFLDENTSPYLATPFSQVSRDSASSTGTIPDFPAPAPRGPTALGPPPSARRGPPTFYSTSTGSVVTPIIEERQPRRIQAKRPQNAPNSYFPGAASENRASDVNKTFFVDESPDEPSIVRSASIGKRARAKPTLVQNRGSDKMDRYDQPQSGVLAKTRNLQNAGMIDNSDGKAATSQFQEAIKTAKDTPPPVPTIVYPSQEQSPKPQWPSFGGDDSPIEGNKELDMMSSSSDDTLTPSPKGEIEMSRLTPAEVLANARLASPALSPSASPNAAEKELGADLGHNEIQYNRHSAIRRPPKLNLNAVRDAEARGSLTSLPDLIRRATKLASMMNEGKRPASRLNALNDFPMDNSEKGSIAPSNQRMSGLSGMLAAFPPPGAQASPLATPRSGSHWPQYASSTKALRTPMDGEHPKRRRCCGMPLWVFLLSLTVIFCVCAAAIVLPLVLIVFKDKDEAPKQISALEICQRDAPCLNGGTSVLNASSCGCVCNNGFEGTRCEKQGSNGCKTVSYFGSEDGEEFNDVTIGSAIPRLVDQAGDMYSVPLAYEALVNQFGRLEVGCSEANALVTYNGDSGASDTDDKETEVSSSKSPGNAAATFTPTSTQGLGRRQGGVDTDILLATGTPKAPAISAAPTAAIAAPTDGPSASGPDSQAAGTNITVSSETLDFARIAVLYILQERSLSEAVDAQANLQSLLSTAELPEGETTGNATITGGLVTWKGSGGQTGTVDLGAWRVSLGNNAQNGDGVGGRAKGGVRAF